MALPTYSTGTASVAVGGTVVTNSGGLWSGINVKQGDFISINDLPAVLITEVTDTTHLMIPPWAEAAQTNVAYVIYQNYVGRVVGVAAAEDVGDMLERLRDQAPIYNVPAGETEPDPSYGTDGQWAYQVETDTWWVKAGGAWVLQDGPPSGVAPVAPTLAFNGLQINGSMEVSQEKGATATSFPAGSSGGYVLDGWNILKVGSNAFNAGQAPSFFLGYGKELKLTITTAQASIGSDYIIIRQSMEGYRTARLSWGTASAVPLTIGFWVRSSVAGIVPLLAVNAAADASVASSVTIASALVAQFVTATFPAQTTGSWFANEGVGLHLNIYPASTSGINLAATNGNTFEITGFVALPGTQAPTAVQSPMIMRPYDQELAICQRYYEKGKEPWFFIFPMSGVTNMYDTIWFKTVKRATPTLAATGWTYFSAGTPTAFTPTFANVMLEQFGFSLAGAANAQGWTGDGTWTADARL